MHNLDLYNATAVWMPQLAAVPFQRNVTLENEMVVNAEKWQLDEKPSVGYYYYFTGYRLQDGTVVYTAAPTIVSVQ